MLSIAVTASGKEMDLISERETNNHFFFQIVLYDYYNNFGEIKYEHLISYCMIKTTFS